VNKIATNVILRIQKLFSGYDRSARKGVLDFTEPQIKPIFIIGPPRTGSTLLYQLMIKHMNTAFISNLMALIPCRMLTVARLSSGKMKQVQEIKESSFGYVPGLHSPNEGGAIMRKWFASELSDHERQYVRNTVVRLSQIFEAPFVTKNLLNSLRLENICAVLPEACFLYFRRDPLFTAQSILLARRKVLGSEGDWLGPKPPGYESILNQSPIYQVVWQVRRIEAYISEFFQDSQSTVFDVTYEGLCKDTERCLRDISQVIQLPLRGESVAPLSGRNRKLLNEEEWGQLVEVHASLYEDSDAS
jgi:LPS sulfotransferase NodH